jgi:hypothetical protein
VPKKQTTQHPVLVENYPAEYSGFPFLTLIEYADERYLTIVDIVTAGTISAYVLDMCKSEGLDDVLIVSLIHSNWEQYKDKPISVLFGALSISKKMARVYRTFQMTDITRVIGRMPVVDITSARTVKRRRRREISSDLISKGV